MQGSRYNFTSDVNFVMGVGGGGNLYEETIVEDQHVLFDHTPEVGFYVQQEIDGSVQWERGINVVTQDHVHLDVAHFYVLLYRLRRGGPTVS